MSQLDLGHHRVKDTDALHYAMHMIEKDFTTDEREQFGRYGIPSYDEFRRAYPDQVPPFAGTVHVKVENPLWRHSLQNVTVHVGENGDTTVPMRIDIPFSFRTESVTVIYRQGGVEVRLSMEARDFFNPDRINMKLRWHTNDRDIVVCDTIDAGWGELPVSTIKNALRRVGRIPNPAGVALLKYSVFAWNVVSRVRSGRGHVSRSLYANTGGKFKDAVNSTVDAAKSINNTFSLKNANTVFQHLKDMKKNKMPQIAAV